MFSAECFDYDTVALEDAARGVGLGVLAQRFLGNICRSVSWPAVLGRSVWFGFLSRMSTFREYCAAGLTLVQDVHANCECVECVNA
jgi:hypothetical protein